MATNKRTSSKAPAKKRASTTRKTTARKTATKPGPRKRKAAAAEEFEADAAGPAGLAPDDATVRGEPAAARSGAAPLLLRPGARRAVFFDVENTSRAEDVDRVLRHLAIDFAHGPLEFTAVGNWRVIGNEPARQLAAHGAALVHSAPSTGVRDWSDLRIAVAAGVWLANAVAGDVIEIVSDDQAFDAVGDVAASRGVVFRRLSYRSLAGLEGPPRERPERERASSGARTSRRRRRGGRRNGRHRPEGVEAPAREPVRAAEEEVDVETAPVDEVVGVVQELVAGSPGGVTLDDVAAALRARGFRRRAGSPRLITRLKLIKDIEVGRDGRIRVAGSVAVPEGEEPSEAAIESAEEAGGVTTTGTRRRRRRRRRPRATGTVAEASAG